MQAICLFLAQKQSQALAVTIRSHPNDLSVTLIMFPNLHTFGKFIHLELKEDMVESQLYDLPT